MMGHSDLRVRKSSIGLRQGNRGHGADDMYDIALNVMLCFEARLTIYTEFFVVGTNC